MTRLARFTAALLLGTLTAPAFAVSKEMVQLQTQIQQLQDAVARLQQSNDERMGVMKDLVQQSADSVNRMSINMDALQKQLAQQGTAEGAKVDQVSGQVQALNDSVDELKTRMARLEKLLADVQNQQSSMAANLGNATPAASAAATLPPPADTSIPATGRPRTLTPLPPTGQTDTPSFNTPRSRTAAAGPAAAPVDDLYKAAISDYMAAKYPVAVSEFNDVIHAYPDHNLAGNAWFYLGEIDFRAGKFSAAARDYDRVIEQFPDNNKVPAAHLHKGQALIQQKQTDAGVRELRALIQRFPNAPEAMQARSRLNGMGIPIKPRT